MFFCSFFIHFSKSVPIHVIGNWSDSYPLDEAKIFFDYVDSSHSNCLENLPQNSSINKILLSCQNLDHTEIGLLNLSLNYRIFHPKASIQNSISGKKPFLNGYLISEQSHITSSNENTLVKQLLTSIYDKNTGKNEKFNKLKQYVQHFRESVKEIENTHINQTLLDEFNSSAHASLNDLMIYINNRQSDMQLYEMIHSLIDEYKTTKVLAKFNKNRFDSSSNTNEFLTYQSEIPNVYVDMPHPSFGAIVKDVVHNQFCAKLPEKINPNAKGFSIYNTKKNLITAYCFIKLFDIEAKSLLKNALDDLSLPRLLSITVFPIFNANNETERRIAFAFQMITSERNGRDGAQFLLNGLTTGYKKAYEKFHPQIDWEYLDCVMQKEYKEFLLLKESSSFIKKKNITQTSLFINGEPYLSRPLYKGFYEALKNQEPTIRKLAQKGVLDNVTLYNPFFRDESIVLNKMNVSMITEKPKYSDITDLDIGSQYNAINTLFKSEIIIQSNQTTNNATHIFIFDQIDNKYNIILNNMSKKFQIIVHDLINSTDNNVNKLFNNNERKVKMSIFAQTFDHFLNKDEFEYHLAVYNHTFKLNNTNSEKDLYLAFLQASDKRNDIKRKDPQSIQLFNSSQLENDPFLIQKGSTNTELTINVMANPLQIYFHELIEVLDAIAETGAAKVNLQIISIINQNFKIHPHMMSNYLFCNPKTNYIDTDSHSFEIISPPNFILIRDGNDFYVESVSLQSFIYDTKFIEIDNKKKSVLNNGLFEYSLPIGRYRSNFIIEDYYLHDSFLSLKKVEYTLNKTYLKLELKRLENDNSIHHDKDETLNVFTILKGPQYEQQLLTMMYTLQQNSTAPVKFWIIGTFNSHVPKNYNIEFLPFVFPKNIKFVKNILIHYMMAKYLLYDLLFPFDIEKVLFVDYRIIWRGDASRFLRLAMKTAASAAVESTDSKDDIFYFNGFQYIQTNSKRPLHQSCLFFINLPKWREKEGRELMYTIFKSQFYFYYESFDIALLYFLQNYIQVMTLPSNTAFNNKNDIKYDPNSLSVYVSNSEFKTAIGEDLSELAKKAFYCSV